MLEPAQSHAPRGEECLSNTLKLKVISGHFIITCFRKKIGNIFCPFCVKGLLERSVHRFPTVSWFYLFMHRCSYVRSGISKKYII